ncbi:MAG: hypothetical protein NVS3B8_09540 [Chitinophagaceae bacterium]
MKSAFPQAGIHEDKLYLYTDHDICPLNEQRYMMKDWLVFSTSDIKTWTEHPVPLSVADFV